MTRDAVDTLIVFDIDRRTTTQLIHPQREIDPELRFTRREPAFESWSDRLPGHRDPLQVRCPELPRIGERRLPASDLCDEGAGYRGVAGSATVTT